MIAGIFHQGSGIGNQLHRYVATRVRAIDLGVDWAMIYNPDGSGKETGFKGQSFMDIGKWDKGLKKTIVKFDITQNPLSGLPSEPEIEYGFWQEKCVRDEFKNDIRSYDPDFNFVEDNTIIDGEFQDPRYFEHRMKEVNEWLKVEPVEVPDDVCVIGFRGGEFSLYPDLFLSEDYWVEAFRKMRQVNPLMVFEVHTDDMALAREFFSKFSDVQSTFPVVHNPAINWRSTRYAKYAIVPNSSFYILPRLLAHDTIPGAVTIAPRYWGRRNTKVWSLPQNYHKQFTHI